MSASSQTNDLKNRIIFTIFILAVYRFGTFVPIPGIGTKVPNLYTAKINIVKSILFLRSLV